MSTRVPLETLRTRIDWQQKIEWEIRRNCKRENSAAELLGWNIGKFEFSWNLITAM